MPEERPIEWIGDPICYKRPKGSGLVVGRYHYLFGETGSLVSVQSISRPVLAAVLQGLYKDEALAMAANIRPGAPPKVYTEEEMQTRVSEGEERLEKQQALLDKQQGQIQALQNGGN